MIIEQMKSRILKGPKVISPVGKEKIVKNAINYGITRRDLFGLTS